MFSLVLCAAILLLVSRAIWKRWRYDLHKIPSAMGLPFFGNILDFACGQAGKQFNQWLGHQLDRLGNPKILRVDMAGASWLFITDMSVLKRIVMTKTNPFPKSSFGDVVLRPMMGNDPNVKALATTTCMTPYVKAVRKVYSTGFQSKNLRRAIPKLNNVLEKTIRIMEQLRVKGPIDIQDLFVKMVLDAIGTVVFDTNLGGLDGSRDLHKLMLECGYITRERMVNPLKAMYVKLFPGSNEALRQSSLLNSLSTEWDRIVKEIDMREDPSSGEEPMWYTLKKLIDPETLKPLERNGLRAEVASIVGAGMDTTGHQLAWIFALLASHPDVQHRIVNELKKKTLYGEDARDVTYEDLGELPYLTAVIKEAMRIASVIASPVPRVVPEDMTILGFRVPKGTLVSTPGNRSIDTVAEWGDPDTFRPERWLEGEDLSRKYFLGFSCGPRDCAGQRLAMLEMRLVIIKLVSKYHFSTSLSSEELMRDTVDGIVVEATNGIWLSATPRIQCYD